MTDVSITWAEVIFRVKWIVFVSRWCYKSGPLNMIGQFSHDGIGWKTRVKFEGELINMTRAWDKEKFRCSGGHGFVSCRGLRIFLCPTLVSCWLIHLHISLPRLKFTIIINLSCKVCHQSLVGFDPSIVSQIGRFLVRLLLVKLSRSVGSPETIRLTLKMTSAQVVETSVT